MPGDQSDELKLLKWVKVSKKRFDMIKNKVQNAKNNNLKARPNTKSLINFNESKKLLQDKEHSKITCEEALNRINNIRSDIKKIIDKESLYPNQVNVVNILFRVDEIFTGKIESLEANGEGNLEVFEEKSGREKQEPDEQLNTTDIPN